MPKRPASISSLRQNVHPGRYFLEPIIGLLRANNKGWPTVSPRLGDMDLAFVLVLLIARGMGFNQGLKGGGREDMLLLEDFKQVSTEVFVCRVQQVNDQILNSGKSEIIIVRHQERRVREVE